MMVTATRSPTWKSPSRRRWRMAAARRAFWVRFAGSPVVAASSARMAAAVSSGRDTKSLGVDWAWLSALIDTKRVRSAATISQALAARWDADEKLGNRDVRGMTLSTKRQAPRLARLSTGG